MVLTQSQARRSVRQDIGGNLEGAEFIVSSTTAIGNVGGTTFEDATLSEAVAGADNIVNGRWIVLTDGDNDGDIRRVSDYDGSTTIVTLRTAATGQIASGATYEMWPAKWPPATINRYLNQALQELTGRVYEEEVENASGNIGTVLHGDYRLSRFNIPTVFDMIRRIEYRDWVKDILIHDCDSLFDETTDVNVTQSNDTEDYKRGRSLKLVVAAGLAAGGFVTDSIGAVDISGYTHLEGWVKSTVTLAANDYVIHLDSGVVQADGTDLESLNVPAAPNANEWIFFRIALATPELDTALVSVGLEMNVDKGAHTVWFDDLRAVREDESGWLALPHRAWSIDRETAELVFKGSAVDSIGFGLIKLIGGSRPTLLTADSDTMDMPEAYLIARATHLALLSDRSQQDSPEGRQRISHWASLAEQAKARLPMLVGVRTIPR